MSLLVIAGDDRVAVAARLRQWQQRHGDADERVDLADGDAAVERLRRAAASPGMFSPTRTLRIDGVGRAGADDALALVAAAAHVAAVAVVDGGLSAAARKRLPDAAEVEVCSAPRGRGLDRRVGEIADAHGVRLSASARRLLVDRAGDRLERVDGVCAQLAAAGAARPEERQVALLLGSHADPPAPWALGDAVARGDLAAALDLADRVEPPAVVAALARRNTQAAELAEAAAGGEQLSAETAATRLGLRSPRAAAPLLETARRAGPEALAAAAADLVAADTRAKAGPEPRAAVDALLPRLAAWWRGEAPVSPRPLRRQVWPHPRVAVELEGAPR